MFIGLIVWAVQVYTPIHQGFKTIILLLGILVAAVLVLNATGVMRDVHDVKVPSIR